MHCPSLRRNKFSLINQLTLDKQAFKATSVIFQCYRCVTTANSLLQVKVDSVTGRDDSLIDSLDSLIRKIRSCVSITQIYWELSDFEMPLNISTDEGPAEVICERTENVNSDSIICQTLTI